MGSGIPIVNVRATLFVETPILTWMPLGPLSNGELRLPFGNQRLAPIAVHDVAEVRVKMLVDPAPHMWALQNNARLRELAVAPSH